MAKNKIFLFFLFVTSRVSSLHECEASWNGRCVCTQIVSIYLQSLGIPTRPQSSSNAATTLYLLPRALWQKIVCREKIPSSSNREVVVNIHWPAERRKKLHTFCSELPARGLSQREPKIARAGQQGQQ